MSFVSITAEEKKEMLSSIGIKSIAELFKDIPESIRLKNLLELPEALSEIEVYKLASKIADKNKCVSSFLGAGSYRHYVPALVDELSGRSEFYTSYTPYQPEVSQGTLTAIFEYQTMIANLTGMEIANASLYDGATALAESVIMVSKSLGKDKVLVSSIIHPNYLEVLKTYCWSANIKIEIVPENKGQTDYTKIDSLLTDEVGAVIIQSPNFFGSIEDVKSVADKAHKKNAKIIIVINEALSLGLLKSPGELGADIVCGEAQSFGNYTGFGGPALGFIAVTKEFMRKLPGRLVGRTTDSDGREAYVLTLQSREQHIRREKATSNICSNEGLIALRAVIYLSLVGKKLKELAGYNHSIASYLKAKLIEKGFEAVFEKPFFNEFVLRYKKLDSIIAKAEKEGFAPGVALGKYFKEYSDCLLITATELNTKEEIDNFIKII
jgi:glycine dehydrogenase subunit 1